jgi:tetratricopeptide (TPR) repeat protein
VFATQDEIANEILKQLRSQLLADEDLMVVEAKRTNPVVYDLYLRAKQRIYTRNSAEISKAISELDKAIQLDPEYPPALAQRGVATMLMSEQSYGDIPDDEAHRRGKRFVDRALSLDENLAEGLAAIGLYYFNQPGGAEQAIEPLTKALSINPNLIDASNWLFGALQGVGDFKGSLEVIVDVTERDPLYRPAFANAIMQFNAYGMPEKAEALLQRIEAFDASNPDLYTARAVNFIFSGRSGEGLQQMELNRELDEMSGVERFILSTGLANTMQFERVIEEGSSGVKPYALYQVGQVDEAIELAHAQASSGYPGNLFYLLNRSNRSKEITDYLEERWPTLSEFAMENPGDEYGYAIMTDVALAYSRSGNQDRFNEAMRFIEQHATRLDENRIDNIFLSFQRALDFALLGDADAAIEYLEDAASRGWSSQGVLADVAPALAVLADDPRYQEVEVVLLNNVNREREIVGLPPLNANYKVEPLPEL